MIVIKHRGNFNNAEKFLRNAKRMNVYRILQSYGEKGVLALSSATPQDTGETSSSWSYQISMTSYGYSLSWSNSNTIDGGTPLVILIQYGHGTGTGGYVEGRDFINPAIRPILDSLATNIFSEVSRL